MLNREDERLITEVGDDRPMGRLLREYWTPVARSAGLIPGAAPRRIQIMGERLVVYRSVDGRVGVMAEACPHRGASMALARNEDCGLRCIYHGWKVDVEGRLVDAPTHPQDADIGRIQTNGYPTREQWGAVWAWFGEAPGPFPKLAMTGLPESHVTVMTAVVRSNWLTMLETVWDTFHSQILHNRSNRRVWQNWERGRIYYSNQGRVAGTLNFDSARYDFQPTDFGFIYRSVDVAKTITYAYVVPFFVHVASGLDETQDQAMQAQVPIDDHTTLYFQWFYNLQAPLAPGGHAHRVFGIYPNHDDFSAHIPRDGGWGQNRGLQNSDDGFTGFEGSPLIPVIDEDIAMSESQQLVMDRSRERLGPTDVFVAQGRKTLLDVVRAHERDGSVFGRGVDASMARSCIIPRPAPVALDS